MKNGKQLPRHYRASYSRGMSEADTKALVARLRMRIEQGYNQKQIHESLNLTRAQLIRICENEGIELLVDGSHRRANDKAGAPDTDGLLAAAALKLRLAGYAQVCAMRTLRRPSLVPIPYHYGTTFLVGTHHDVPALELLEMANAL